MSRCSTPPVDRLAVRTFIMPFDSVVIREAIQRERFRGGQIFCVVPRVEDLGRMAERLAPRGINYWENKDRSDRRLLFQRNKK